MTIVDEIRQDPQRGAKRLESEYRAGLTTLARRFCADEGDAAELVNRTFAEVLSGIDRYAEQSAFFGWMSRILVNLHTKDIRRKSNGTVFADADLPEAEPDPEAESRIYREVDAAILRDAVGALPSEMRDAVVLRYFMDMPLARVAKILAVPEGTVNSRLHYARLALAAKLGAAAKKPGVKALLIALALAAITAAGAATTLAVVRLLSPKPAAPEQQAYDSKNEATPLAVVRLLSSKPTAQEQQAYDSKNAATQEQQPDESASWLPLIAIEPLLPTSTPKKETPMNTTTRSVALGAATALAFASTAEANLPRLDSALFDYKYDMVKLPTEEDLDASGANDFTGSGTWRTLGTGTNVGTVLMTINGGQNFISDKAVGTAGDAWRSLGATSDSGYTIETRLKVTACTGNNGALLLNASYGVVNHNSWLQFHDDRITWGSNVLTNMDTSVWHTYRLVRLSGENTYHVYVDGVLVNGSLSNGFGYSSALNRLLIGGGGAGYAGAAQVAWLRFHKGAFAPPLANDKSRRKASTDFPVQYEMAADDTRISTSANASDWTISGQSDVAITKSGGVLSVTPPAGKQPYWRTTDSVWKDSVTSNTAFTVDVAAQIKSCTISGDRTLQLWVASPRATGILNIGMNHVYWQLTDQMADNVLLDSSDNSNGKHVFRIAYDGKTHHGFTVWRDGEKLGEDLVDNRKWNGASFSWVRFGIPGNTVGGAFDIDYIRWDTTGAYDWKDPPQPFILVIH